MWHDSAVSADHDSDSCGDIDMKSGATDLPSVPLQRMQRLSAGGLSLLLLVSFRVGIGKAAPSLPGSAGRSRCPC